MIFAVEAGTLRATGSYPARSAKFRANGVDLSLLLAEVAA
jgi:hypothetical protein